MLTSGPTFARVVRLTTLLTACGAAGIAACSDDPTSPSMRPERPSRSAGVSALTPSLSRSDTVAGVVYTGGGILAVSTLSLDFGTQEVGSRTASQPVTISNVGPGAMTLSWLAPTGGDAFDFIIDGIVWIAPNAGRACTYPMIIAPDSSCIAQISFLPTAAGPRVATINVQTDGGSAAVTVVGTGVLPAADVGVSVSATPSPATVGKPLTYTITVRNAGPAAAKGVQLAAIVPSATTFTSISAPPDVVCATPAVGGTGSVSCSINASLEAGGARTITLIVKPLSGGKTSVSNTVSVLSDSPDPNSANNSVAVVTTVRGRK